MKSFYKYIVEDNKPVPDDIRKNFINFDNKDEPNYKYSLYNFHIYYGDNQSYLFQRGNFCIADRIDISRLTEIMNASKIYTKFLTDAKNKTKELEKKYGGRKNIEKEYGYYYKVYFEHQYSEIDKRLEQIKKNSSIWKNMYNVAKLAGKNAKSFQYEDDIVELYDINGKNTYKGIYDSLNSDIKKDIDYRVFCPLLNMYVVLRKISAIEIKIGCFMIVRK